MWLPPELFRMTNWLVRSKPLSNTISCLVEPGKDDLSKERAKLQCGSCRTSGPDQACSHPRLSSWRELVCCGVVSGQTLVLPSGAIPGEPWTGRPAVCESHEGASIFW